MNKILIVTLFFLVSLTVQKAFGGTGAIPSGPNIKMLKDNIRFKNINVRIMSNDTDDPSAVAKDSEAGSIYIRGGTNDLYIKQDSGSSTNWNILPTIGGVTGTGTDNRVTRFDGTTDVQDSLAVLDDLGALSGLTQLNVDNLQLDGNTISSTDVNGPINLTPNGAGEVVAATLEVTDLTDDRIIRADGANGLVTTGIEVNVSDEILGATRLTVDNLQLDGNTIISTDVNGNINLTPNGVGENVLSTLEVTDFTDDRLIRADGANGLVTSGVEINASDEILSVTRLTVDNLELNANTIASTDLNGDIILDPDGTGNINFPDLTASTPLKLDASNNVITADIDLTTDVTGILPIANGGTNTSTVPTNGQLLIGNATDYTVATLTGTVNQINIANGAGSITLSAPQDIHTGATPTFSDLILSSFTEDSVLFIGAAGAVNEDNANFNWDDPTDTLSITGVFDADNLRLDGNTLSSQDVNGDIVLDPNGAGAVNLPDLTISQPAYINASGDLVSQDLDLTADVTGVLPIANGGTNSSTAVNNDRIMVSSGGAIVEAAALTNGQLLIGQTAGAPVAANIAGTANQVTVTNGAGSITLSLPQDIHSGASPTFTDLTLSNLTQNSVVFVGAAGILDEDNANFTFTDGTDTLDVTGIITIDNLRLNGNTIDTTDVNGDLLLDANGTGDSIFLSDDVLHRTNTTLDNTVGKQFRDVRNFYVKGDADFGIAGDFNNGNNGTFDGGGVLAGTFTVSTAAADVIDSDLTRTYQFTQAAGSLNDYIASETINIPQGYRGNELGYFFHYRYDGLDDEIEVQAKCMTSTDLLSTGTAGADLALKAFDNADNTAKEVRGTIFVKQDCTQVRFGFSVATLNSGAILEFDEVKITPSLRKTSEGLREQTLELTAAHNTFQDRTSELRFPSTLDTTDFSGDPILEIVDNAGSTRTEFTALRDCIVHVSFNANAGSSGRQMAVFKNSTIVVGGSEAISGSNQTTHVSAPGIELSAGDYFTIGSAQNNAADADTIQNLAAVTLLSVYASAKDDVSLEPMQSNLTEWTAYTPTITGFGTAANVDFKFRRVGDSIEIQGTFESGTSTAVEGQITLPTSPIAHTVVTGDPIRNVGHWFLGATSTEHGGAVLATGGDAFLNLSDVGIFSNTSLNAMSPADGDAIAASTNTVNIKATIQIQELTGSAAEQFLFANPLDNKCNVTESRTVDLASVANTANIRALNTTNGGCDWLSVAGSQVTLGRGVYQVKGWGTLSRVNDGQIYLWDDDNSVIPSECTGPGLDIASASGAVAQLSFECTISITTLTNYELITWTESADAAGLCEVTHAGTNNDAAATVCAGLKIEKIE